MSDCKHNNKLAVTILHGNGAMSGSLLCSDCQKSVIETAEANNHRVLVRIFDELNVPKRLRENIPHKLPVNAAIRDRIAKGIYLIGAPGVGKTTTMLAYLCCSIFNGSKVAYIDWSDFICKLKSDITKSASIFNDLVTKTEDCTCIFIDDFSVPTQYFYDFTYDFIKKLYNNQKEVYFTSVELPTAVEIANKIGQMTVQVEVFRK